MAGQPRMLEGGLVQLYARALVAIARADEEIGRDEGLALQERIDARSGQAIPLDDLLLTEPLDPAQLADAVRGSAGPFREARTHPAELARMLVSDGVAVVMAKGHVSEHEAQQIIRFATALGCTLAEVRAMSEQLAPWIAA